MNKFLILCAIFSIVSYSECLDSVPVDFLYKSNAVLDCSSANFDGEVEFYKVTKNEDDEEVREKVVPFQDKDGNEKVILEKSTLTLVDLRRPEITPEYICKSHTSDEELKFVKQIHPFMMVPEKLSQTITEGGFADFECEILYGNDTEITWSWTRNGTEIDEDNEAFNIVKDQRHSKLTINPIAEEHKGLIMCTVNNEFGSHNSEFQLRVKNTLAALWPFLGICAEVLVLCVIILIYEKKCNKKPKNTGEDNEQAENLMGKDSNADLKKRNPKV